MITRENLNTIERFIKKASLELFICKFGVKGKYIWESFDSTEKNVPETYNRLNIEDQIIFLKMINEF